MRLRLTLDSDTLFGSGYGLSSTLDADVEHDARTGVPFVRGRTLKGLLAEGCADVLGVLVAAAPALEDRLLAAGLHLFGMPGSTADARGRLRIGTARLPRAFEREVTRQVSRGETTVAHVLASLTVIRRRTAIDEATGTPERGSLRTMRLLRAGLVFTAPLDVDALGDDAWFLLALACAAVQRGGTGRTRGAGALRLVLLAPDGTDLTAAAVGALEDVAGGGAVPAAFSSARETSAAPVVATAGGASSGADAASETDGGWAIRVRVRLREPLLVRGGIADANTGMSLPSIPGASIRGACVGRHLAATGSATGSAPGIGSDLAADALARRLFFDGDIDFLPAYPVSGDARAVPTPASWFTDKLTRSHGADASQGGGLPRAHPARTDGDASQWRRVRKPFTANRADGLHASGETASIERVLVAPERRISVHIQRARGYAPSGDADRALYRYDALDAGQVFETVLLCRTDEARRHVHAWMRGTLPIGGASTAGYGAVEIESVDEMPRASWHEGPRRPAVAAGDAHVAVLTSPLVVRDASTGLPSTTRAALAAALGDALGVSVEVTGSWGETERASGFNRTWGLPLPQMAAWAAGTTIAFTARGVSAAALAALVRDGLGEGRVSGYGRLMLDAFTAPTWTFAAAGEQAASRTTTDAGPSDVGSGRAAALTAGLAATQRATHTRESTAARARRLAGGARRVDVLTRAQIGRVQQILRDATAADTATAGTRLDAFFKGLPMDARRKWGSVRIDGKKGDEWLRATVGSARSEGSAGGDGSVSAGDLPDGIALAFSVLSLLAKHSHAHASD